MRKISNSLKRFKFIDRETFEPTRVGRIRVSKKGLILCVTPATFDGQEFAAWLPYTTASEIVLNPANWAAIHVAADNGECELYMGDSSQYMVELDASSWFNVKVRSADSTSS